MILSPRNWKRLLRSGRNLENLPKMEVNLGKWRAREFTVFANELSFEGFFFHLSWTLESHCDLKQCLSMHAAQACWFLVYRKLTVLGEDGFPVDLTETDNHRFPLFHSCPLMVPLFSVKQTPYEWVPFLLCSLCPFLPFPMSMRLGKLARLCARC